MAAPGREWRDEIKARIQRRYNRLPEERAGRPTGARRMLEDGYPAGVIAGVGAALAEHYSGCGYPEISLDRLREIRVVADLGCGAGIDACWISARMAPGGAVIAVDMADGMLKALGRLRNTDAASRGMILAVAADLEQLPLASDSVDLVVANASFNLTVDKPAAFREAWRILKPGGQLAARDLVRDGALPAEVLEDPLADVTSLGGAESEEALRSGLARAGFCDVRIGGHRPFSFLTSVRIDAFKPPRSTT